MRKIGMLYHMNNIFRHIYIIENDLVNKFFIFQTKENISAREKKECISKKDFWIVLFLNRNRVEKTYRK